MDRIAKARQKWQDVANFGKQITSSQQIAQQMADFYQARLDNYLSAKAKIQAATQ